MAKALSSVIGVDLGRYALKSVMLERKGGDHYVVTHYASKVLGAPVESAESLGKELKSLFKNMGGTARACAVGVSSPDALIRIIEQTETPVDILRDALRYNGMALLNQDCKEFVLDCDYIPSSDQSADPETAGKKKYLVGGLPRAQVSLIGNALDHTGSKVHGLQLAPICAFNAFELAYPEVFNEQAFFLVDIGHTGSTVMVGAKRELILVRTIDFGGKALLEGLAAMSGEERESVIVALEQEDEVMMEYCRHALSTLIREIQSSIGFLEHRREETVSKVFISGGPAKSPALLHVLSEELAVPCEAWSVAGKFEAGLPAGRAEEFARDILDLNVACGAAAEALKGK